MKEIRFSFDDDVKNDNNENDIENEEFYEEINCANDESGENSPAEETNEETLYNDDHYESEDEITEKKKTSNNKRTRRRPLVIRKLILGAAAAAAIALIMLASPIFSVNKIEVNELSYFTKDEICSMIGLSQGDNGIFFNRSKAEKILEKNQYISSVKISFQLPDTMKITVTENKICGYIPYLSSYLYIDREGRVIDIKSEATEKIPIIEGLKFGSFKQGEIIPVENKDAFDAALVISRAMSKYEMLDKAVSINVADKDNIYAYVENIRVLLGDTSRMEEKIKTMSEAVKEIPEGDRGTLDLQDLSKPIIFKYST